MGIERCSSGSRFQTTARSNRQIRSTWYLSRDNPRVSSLSRWGRHFNFRSNVVNLATTDSSWVLCRKKGVGKLTGGSINVYLGTPFYNPLNIRKIRAPVRAAPGTNYIDGQESPLYNQARQ
jgi:hypothetical protein